MNFPRAAIKALRGMTASARLTRRGARSIVRSSTWYPAGSGVGFGVFVVHAWGAMVELCEFCADVTLEPAPAHRSTHLGGKTRVCLRFRET